jgi:hypothetical protein
MSRHGQWYYLVGTRTLIVRLGNAASRWQNDFSTEELWPMELI